MKLSWSLLERSPEETARHLALGLLGEADEALARMQDPGDAEALHDFRVALRRLRSVLRAYGSHLKGSAPKKLRARLKSLASSTNVARDTEVQLEWLESASKDFDDVERGGAEYLAERLRGKRQAAPTRERLESEFLALRKDLTRSLSRMRLRLDEAESNFVGATSRLVGRHAGTLRHRLSSVRSSADVDALHDARIETKRLRYLLEPLREEVRLVREIVQKMKSLQDLLGELQDARVLVEEISSALEEAALEEVVRLRDFAFGAGPGSAEAALPDRTSGHPGLLAVLKRQRDRIDRRYDELARTWLAEPGPAFFQELDLLVDALRVWPERPRTRRRFLLDRLPDSVRSQRGRFLREGWLPGKDVRERVASERAGGRVRYERTLTRSSERPIGPPVAERLSRRSFEALWSLTEGRRLERTRYEILDGGRRWLLDDFRGRGLVLAEVEGGADLPLPDWLEAVVRLEVTDSPEYEPERLARSSRNPPRPRLTASRARSAPETRGDPKDESR